MGQYEQGNNSMLIGVIIWGGGAVGNCGQQSSPTAQHKRGPQHSAGLLDFARRGKGTMMCVLGGILSPTLSARIIDFVVIITTPGKSTRITPNIIRKESIVSSHRSEIGGCVCPAGYNEDGRAIQISPRK